MRTWFHEPTRKTNDDGAALVMVLGIMMVGAVILTTLVLVTIYNTRYTAYSREEIETLASADAGIDIVLGQLEGKTYEELSTVCEPSSPYVINNDEVVVKFDYTVNRGGAIYTDVACPSLDDIVTSLTVTSTATAAADAATGEEIVRAVQATFAPTPPEVTLSKAIFSESSLELINNSVVSESSEGALDGNVYSNGAITIKAQVDVEGQIYSSYGDITVDNLATLDGTVWAAGKVVLATGATVTGDVYAASDATGSGTSAAVVLGASNTTVTGSVLTNGSIYSQGRPNNGGIGGIAFSRTSTIELDNGATTGGSAYAYDKITLGNSSVVGGDALSLTGDIYTQNNATVTGTAKAGGTVANKVTSTAGVKLSNVSGLSFPIESNINPTGTTFAGGVGYPYLITAPQREPMPQISMSDEDIALWVAAGWTVDSTTDCTGNDPGNFINDNPNGITGPRLIVFDCSSGGVVELNGANTHDIYITQDTALVSATGFYQSNKISYHGNDDDYWTLYWIVPSDSDGITWTEVEAGQYAPSCSGLSSPVGDIYWDQMKIEGLEWFIYTPCTVTFKNGNNATGGTLPVTGQVYGGSVVVPTATKFQMSLIPIPSLSNGTASPTDPAEVRLTSRYDLRE